MTRNPFRLNEDTLTGDLLEEELLEIKCHSTAKTDFEEMPLTEFWEKYVHIYRASVRIFTLGCKDQHRTPSFCSPCRNLYSLFVE